MTSTLSPSTAVMRAFCDGGSSTSPLMEPRTETRLNRSSCRSSPLALLPAGDAANAGGELAAAWLLPGDGTVETRAGEAAAALACFAGEALSANTACVEGFGEAAPDFGAGTGAPEAVAAFVAPASEAEEVVRRRFAAGSPSSPLPPSRLSSSLGWRSKRGPGMMARSLAPRIRVFVLTKCSSSNSLSIKPCSSAEPASWLGFGRNTSKHSGEYEVAFAGALTLP
mmetsp:Transcript_98992/g.262993  ORF Transcript_98992/g.262993 Transcript_98992/m.262993 type:complete len:225 (+) Transcript_98992:313-987(+)